MGQFSCSIAPVKSPTLDVTIQSTAHIVEPPGEKVRTIASTAFIVRRRPISNVADLFAPVRTRFVVEGPSKRTDPEPT